MSNESVMPSNHLILCCPLLLLPSVFPSIRIFSSESTLCIRWPQYWSFSFSISSSNEYSRLIFFKTDWFDLLAVQGTRKSLLQHHSSKASVLQCSAFFMVQLARVCTFQILILPHCYPTGFHFSSSYQNMIPLSASSFLSVSGDHLFGPSCSSSPLRKHPECSHLSLFTDLTQVHSFNFHGCAEAAQPSALPGVPSEHQTLNPTFPFMSPPGVPCATETQHD